MIEENEDCRRVSDDELDEFCHHNHYVGWYDLWCISNPCTFLSLVLLCFCVFRFTTSAKNGLNVKKGMNFIITRVMKNKKKVDAISCEPEQGGFHLTNDNFTSTNEPNQGNCACLLI